MNNNYKTALVILLGLFSVEPQAADSAAGKARAAACQGCHGAAGVSASPLWPSLAGQSAAYIEAQLHKFKIGERENPVMKPIAEGLSDADIQNLAAYFVGLPAKAAGGDPALAAQGKDKVAMCMGCHGEKLGGNGQFPRLAGQQPAYLGKQMHDFKSGARKAGPMNALAQTLADGDIKAIAAYLGSLGN